MTKPDNVDKSKQNARLGEHKYKKDAAVDAWLSTIKTASQVTYGTCVKRLLEDMEMTGTQVLAKVKPEAKQNEWDTYDELCDYANNHYKENVAYLAITGLRAFLRVNHIRNLPKADLHKPNLVKPEAYMTWEQAKRVCDAASKPYSSILKLMLHCGWGVGQFVQFNTKDNWSKVENYIKEQNRKAEHERKPYYPFTFMGRKTNRKAFCSYVPLTVLTDVLTNDNVPLRTAGGRILDTSDTHYATNYIDSAFETALFRAAVKVEGKPSPHELRDSFRTHAYEAHCEEKIAEYAMGHSIDPLNYNKIHHNESYVWKELSKLYAPTTVTEDALEHRDEKIRSLEREITQLKGQFETFSKGKFTSD